jgi:polyisoprenoid-binding protein YceI
MKRLLIALTLLLPALASAHDWQVDAAHSTLGFSGEYQDGPFHGTFKHFTAKIAYDPADLAHARFDVEVDLASVDTQSAERDQTLAGSDFFDTAKTPKAASPPTARSRCTASANPSR